MEVPRPDIAAYGCIQPERVEEHLDRVVSIVEKPDPDEAPSNVAAIGRYVFTPEIFEALSRIEPGAGGELQLTDAINILAQEQAVYAYRFDDGRYDVGNPLDYLKATVELAVERDDVGPAFRTWLAEFVQRHKLL
jgi:UTP--glucose-1-phosphate uridylyltransferase